MMHRRLLPLMAALGILLAPTVSNAIDGCKVKIDTHTGDLLISASNVTGTPLWGPSAAQATNAFSNTGLCLVAGKMSKCLLGSTGSALAVTPPELCRIAIADDVSNCLSAPIKGCTPGLRTHVDGTQIVDATITAADLAPGALNGVISASDFAPGALPLNVIGRITLNGAPQLSNGTTGLNPAAILSVGTTGGPGGGEFTYSQLAGSTTSKLPCENTVASSGGSDPCGTARESVGMIFTVSRAGDYEVCADASFHTFIYLLKDGGGWRPQGDVTVKLQLAETGATSVVPIQSGEIKYSSINRYWVNTPLNDGMQFNDDSTSSWCSVFSFASPGEKTIRLLGAADVSSSINVGRPCDNAGCSASLVGTVRLSIREVPES